MNEPRQRNRRWIWIFVALAILGLLAIGINLGYNLSEPLTPERLAAARALWKANRPTDYDLRVGFTRAYSSVDGTGGTMIDKIELQVRGGKVTAFLINGKEPEPLLDADGRRKVIEERLRQENYDIDGLFDSIEELMERDRRDGRKSFIRARFDKKDGRLILFTRQYQGKREQHILVDINRIR